MFGIGGAELFIILIFAFLIVGPDKIPEAARTIGKAIARFRDAQQEMKDAFGGEKIIDLDNPDEPIKDPLEVLDRAAQRREDKQAAKKTQKQASSGTKKPSESQGQSQAAKVEESQNTHQQNDSEANETDGLNSDKPRESFSERKARYERERAAQKAKAAENSAENAGENPAENAAEKTADQDESSSPSSHEEGGER